MQTGQDRYKWVALANTTFGVVMATIDSSIMLIALPDIFQGIHLSPLQPGNSFYLLWMILSFLVVSSVLVVSLGRLGDMFGRVRMYNLGFAVYTLSSLVLTVDWLQGQGGALYLVVGRIFQGVGAAFLVANSSAILTDAFPEGQRGLALGVNNVAGISGSFIGLVLGGVLGPVDWRLVFLVSVPFGLAGTLWAHYKLHELSARRPAKVDWPGNVTFACGLVAVMVGITYGIQPYGGHDMGWSNPAVIAELAAGAALLVAFCAIERRSAEPMFRLQLFRIRAFTAGVLSSFLAALARGGLMFMMIIWLQGIWLPEHGYSFGSTPLWAGIYMLPLTAGFLVAGPVSGLLSDRFGARPFASGGMLAATASFVLLQLLPVDFSYWQFAGLLFLNGLAMGAFASPNRAGVMNSLPAQHRGAGSGMNATFQNSAQVLSIGIFFTLVIVGLSSSLPSSLLHGLVSQGVPRSQAARVARLPPVSTLFAAFLGYDPMAHLLPRAVLHGLTRAQSSTLLGRSFFPRLIAAPFGSGLRTALDFAAAGCAVAAAASWARGRRYVYQPEVDAGTTEVGGQGPAGGRGPAPGDGEAGRDERHRGEVRRAGRVLLVDEDDEVLLLCGRDPSVAAAERFWFVPGGGAEDGESVEHAALREVREEVGAVLAEADLGPVVWARRVAFEFDGHRYDQDERFWVVRVARFASRPTGLTDMEVRMGTRARWWSLAELAGLDEPVYPHGLAALAANWLAEGPPPAPLDITGH